MLVLSRRLGEKIVFTFANGEKVEITINSIVRGAVKLGFEADNSISIDRKEVIEAKRDLSNDPRFTPMRRPKQS